MHFADARLSLLIAVSVALPTFSFAATDVKPTPFVATVMSNWDAWDSDRDQTLSKEEINKAATDPAITGDAAAAIASLKQVSRNAKVTLPPLTKSYFEQYSLEAAPTLGQESAKDAVNATVDPGVNDAAKAAEAKGPALNWDRYFIASKARIALGGTGPIWGKSLNPANMKQGPLGDCFFVATVGSLALRDPGRVQTLVTPAGDGKFTAHFPNTEPFTFDAPTQALLAGSGTTAENGAWLAVLEQAFGKQKSRLKGGSIDVDGTDVLRTGGDSMPTIEAITGHKAKRISFGGSVEDRTAKEATTLPQIRSMLTDALASGRIAVCGGCQLMKSDATPSKEAGPTTRPTIVPAEALGKVPKQINMNHVYSVVSFDAASDVVEIWNPHHNNFTPTGPDGLVNGYTTKDGRFKAPLKEVAMFYGSFTFETAEPVTPKPAK